MMKLGKILLLLLCLLTACVAEEKADLPVYQGLDDLKGKKVGIPTGSYIGQVLDKKYPELELLRMDSSTDLVQALVTKRCEALVMDDYMFNYYTHAIKGAVALDKPFDSAEMALCFAKGKNLDLQEQFKTFIRQIKADGTYDEMYDRWMYHAHETVMPDIPMPKDGNPVRVVTSSTAPPLVYIENGKLVGFEVELLNRFSAFIGRPLVWSDMNFSAIIPALVSGTQDIASGGINITPARKESVDFTDPTMITNTFIGIRVENSAGYVAGTDENHSEPFIDSVKKSFYRNILEENRYLMIWDGLKVSALIALLASVFGTLLGGLVCWMRMSSYSLLRRLAGFYIALMRGTPILVLLMIMFYVVFAGTSITAVMVSVITFGMNFAAYVSEMFRSSIENVDRGQTEAGVALGFTPVQTFVYIVMPQAFKQVMPVYKGELVSLVKMTSIVGYIAVQDLTKVGDIIRSRTFDAFFPLIMVAVLYFILSWIFATVLDLIGKKLS